MNRHLHGGARGPAVERSVQKFLGGRVESATLLLGVHKCTEGGNYEIPLWQVRALGLQVRALVELGHACYVFDIFAIHVKGKYEHGELGT